MELGPRDRLSQAFVQEQRKGRTIETPYGHVVHLDVRHLGEKTINAKIPFVRELCQKYQNLDPVTDMIPVRPVVHYMMGGVHTDIDGATSLAGLYAAGEVACVSINGANRLGSNSLPELLVFGARAGRAAAEYASLAAPIGEHVTAQVQDERRRLERDILGKTGGRERIADIRDQMQKTLEESAGIYRHVWLTIADPVKVVVALLEKTGRVPEKVTDALLTAVRDFEKTFGVLPAGVSVEHVRG